MDEFSVASRSHDTIAARKGFDMKPQKNSPSRMTRKTFLKAAAAFSASALSLDMGAAQPQTSRPTRRHPSVLL